MKGSKGARKPKSGQMQTLAKWKENKYKHFSSMTSHQKSNDPLSLSLTLSRLFSLILTVPLPLVPSLSEEIML